MNDNQNNLLQRRNAIKGIASLAVAGLTIACSGGNTNSLNNNGFPSGNNGENNGGAPSGGGNTGTGTTESPIELVTDWAKGGTSSLTDNFPGNSIFEFGSACDVKLTGAQTEGPCYFSTDLRDDISSGQAGLPMQMCLQLVDSNCQPLANHEIEVWHCDIAGIYSGDTSSSGDAGRFQSGFCTGGNNAAQVSTWFRGTLISDENGRVNFKTCFPGWYPSRAIHVHFRVKNNNNDEIISQFGFADEFCNYLCHVHEEYSGNGIPDTSLTSDTVFGSDYQDYLFNLRQNSDGSLLAYKRIVIS